MRLLQCAWTFLLLFASLARADATYAVARLTSHGGSATCIYTTQGQSIFLSCAHAFQGLDRYKRIVLDTPCPDRAGLPRKVGITLLALDYDTDLSLLELRDGPLPYVAPVAPPDHHPGRLVSCGYDEMKPSAPGMPQVYQAHVVEVSGKTTFTQERPWPGRSGGGLIDVDNGYLCCVATGYEVVGRRRGIYVRLAAVQQFLTAHGYGWLISGSEEPQQTPIAHVEPSLPALPRITEFPNYGYRPGTRYQQATPPRLFRICWPASQQ